ncbi:RNA ligase family protein [Croceicoccus sp. 1NDH52]|nr:RNA ligase family protein [Croceicoccus gelatinilyticus]
MHDDDRMMPTSTFLEGRRIIATEKMDGENTSIYTRDLHARSPDGRGHPSRDRVKAWASTFQHEIPEGWRIVGENVTAVHSIAYDDLPHIFLGFQVWNERNICLPWDETLEWFELLGITPVRVLYDGIYDEPALRALYDERRDWESREGYVVRLAGSFAMSEYPQAVGKFVRCDHVQTAKHNWASQPFVPNGLAADATI